MEGITSIETSFSPFPNTSCESINATDEKLNSIGSFVINDQQPESSSILMRGPNLADTSGFTGGRPSGPDKSADRPNAGGGFGNSTSPPEILDRGSRTSNEPATPVKSPQTEKPSTPSKGNTNSSETKVPPAPPETKQQQTSSEVPTKQILDKGDQLKDKMQSMKESQPLEAAPINTNQVEKGFLSKIWENINSNNDDIVMPPSKEVQKEHDHTPSPEKPSIQTIRDNESISKLDMQNSQQSEKGFLQTIWDNLNSFPSDDTVMPPKSPEKNTAPMNQAALNETPTSNDERVVNVIDQTKTEEKGLLSKLWEYFITDTNSIVCNSYFQKPELQVKTAGLPPLKREEFQNVGDMVLNMSDDGKSCTIVFNTFGLGNDLETQTKYMNRVEDISGLKCNLASTYNMSTNGKTAIGKVTAYVVNAFNAAGAKLGFETQGNRNILKSCIDAAIVAQEKGLKYKIVILAYSKGGAEASQAIDDLINDKDLRIQEIAKHVDFIGVASTHCVEKGKVNLVQHIVVDGDGVAKGSAYYLHALQEGTVINLEKNKEISSQHDFGNSAYQTALKMLLNKYKNEL